MLRHETGVLMTVKRTAMQLLVSSTLVSADSTGSNPCYVYIDVFSKFLP